MENRSNAIMGKAYQYLRNHRYEFNKLSKEYHLTLTTLMSYYYNPLHLNEAPFWIVRKFADKYNEEQIAETLSNEEIKQFNTELKTNIVYMLDHNEKAKAIIYENVANNPALLIKLYMLDHEKKGQD